jgi:hypothetical protein
VPKNDQDKKRTSIMDGRWGINIDIEGFSTNYDTAKIERKNKKE